MIGQFEINNYAKKRINEFLEQHQSTLLDAMNDENLNKGLAEILHDGFPTMVKKIYSLTKFQTFFWEKRELLFTHIESRLLALDKPAKK